MIKINYKGGQFAFDKNITPRDVLSQVDPSILPTCISSELNGLIWDLFRAIPNGEHTLSIIQFDSEKGLDIMRHSTAHVMAEAIKSIFPGTKLAIGPTIENGFYYDVLPPKPITDSDLPKIEQEMRSIIKKNSFFERIDVSRDEALKIVKQNGEDFKYEIISQIDPKDQISFYKDGGFVDLCRGPHVPSTGWIKAFKLQKISGAYWRGDDKNQMLTRIYGIAFESEDKLKKYLELIEKAKEVDHRKLGTQLDIFSQHLEIGPGLTLWHPNGAIIKHLIEREWYDLHIKNDYKIVSTPHIATEDLFKISGHLENYKDFMFGAIETDNRRYRLKPMNCPFHITIYKSSLHSYKELPLRYAEMGTVYRYEKGGVLHGLLRVRSFTIDDAHIFVRPDQIEEEVNRVYDLTLRFMNRFGFSNIETELSTRPKEYIGSIEEWDNAIKSLENVLSKRGAKFIVDEGGGAFYGPKISMGIKDSLGRKWQCSTVQLDFNLSQRFELTYMDENNKLVRPFIIHRALMGSIDRFIGVLTEHYEGKLPFWLSPTQVKILTLGEEQSSYAREIEKTLKDNLIRTKLDLSNERIGNKIRVAVGEKIPVIFVLGVKESQENSVSIRQRGSDKQVTIKKDQVMDFLSALKSN